MDHGRIETVIVGPPGPVVREIAIGGGSAWVSGYQEILRIDEQTHELVQRIRVDGHAEAIAADRDRVWTVVDRQQLIGIDTSTGRAISKVRVPGQVNDVATGPLGVWAVSDQGIYEIDPSGLGVTLRRPAGRGQVPSAVAVSDDRVWVVTTNGDSCSASTESRVLAMDPASGHVMVRRSVDGPVRGVAAGDGAVWVTENEGCDYDRAAVSTVLRFDDALHLTATTPVGRLANTPSVGHGGVWVGYSPRFDADDTIAMLDPATGEVVDTVVSNGFTQSTVASDHDVWSTNAPDAPGEDTITIVD